MILGRLNQWRRYAALHPQFEEAFRFLETADTLENGRYELGGRMYATVSEVGTRPAASYDFEAHRQFIDIQYLLGGHSVLTWGDTYALSPAGDYAADRDIQFFSGEGRSVQVRQGDFYILWPEDAHKPHGTDGEASTYR
ncbi:MAG: YhcH/YjgK/YiaL family protein, partial [Clostridia bacterium]|nr:YhcH/YjgK/YiaL family protein [Clostridia bacterium]